MCVANYCVMMGGLLFCVDFNVSVLVLHYLRVLNLFYVVMLRGLWFVVCLCLCVVCACMFQVSLDAVCVSVCVLMCVVLCVLLCLCVS